MTDKRKDTQDQQYCHEAAKKITKLSEPVKQLSISRLMYLKKDQLNEIGKATRALYEVLQKNGLVSRSSKL